MPAQLTPSVTPDLVAAMAEAGQSEQLRNAIFEALRHAEAESTDATRFRTQVRWPIIVALLQTAQTHRVVLDNGLIFDVSLEAGSDWRIEQALLMSTMARPDHFWEPQTTKLLVALGAGSPNVIVGGGYVGDQIVPVSHAMYDQERPGVVHAFEPVRTNYERLLHNLTINNITNVIAHRLALWDSAAKTIQIRGKSSLASAMRGEGDSADTGEDADCVTIDDYVEARQLSSVGLVMLDMEGSEEKALVGAMKLLSRPYPHAPHLVFEIHRTYMDWSRGLENTTITTMLRSQGYELYAIRDFQGNYDMRGKPVEVIPADRVYLQGPPHGFNMLATKDPDLVRRLDLVVVNDVSPKLLLHRDPLLHHPVGGL